MTQAQIIENLNTLFAPLGLKVDEVVSGAQSTKYKLNLPLDFNIQGKIRRNENNLKYSIPSAIDTTNFIYGKDDKSVFIEIKNDSFTPVRFNDFSAACNTGKLNLVLGVDENGQKVFTNLSKAPHILIGGTTGSGKSELLHCFIMSLLSNMYKTHAELIIIDPKRAEYTPYRGLNRVSLITEMDEAVKRLNNAVEQMEYRYKVIEYAGAKDIYTYHGSEDLHPIIIIIDELADLMQSHPEVESSIVRIAQKARACGIHLIIGTQSPRRNVVTGLIQSNMPTKIALHTADQIESRIILGKGGAEHLFGKGDMLYLGNGKFEPMRIQSAYVDEFTKKNIRNTIKPVAPIVETKPEPEPTLEWGTKEYEEKLKEEIAANRKKYQQPKRKRVGFFQGLKNIWNVKPIMFRTDDYPPKI